MEVEPLSTAREIAAAVRLETQAVLLLLQKECSPQYDWDTKRSASG